MKFQHPFLDFEWTHGGTPRQALSNMPLQTFQCRGIIYNNNNSIHGHKSVYLSQVIRLFCPENACPDQLMQKGNDPDIRFNLICRCL